MSAQYSAEWVHKAEEDYLAALTLARQKKISTPNAVCFHAQQCAEKYLKAFLAARDVDIPRIHDLNQLNDLCTALDADFAMLAESLIALNPYAVEFRYPGESATVEEARHAITLMQQVRSFIRAKLGLTPRQQ